MQAQNMILPQRAVARAGSVALALALALCPAAFAVAGGNPPPDTQFTQVEPDPTNDPTGDFQFTSTIPGSTFECSVDAAVFAACTTPFHTVALADGTHVFQVRAKEPGGVVDPTPAEHTWHVDTVRPDTTITDGPSGGVTTSTAVFTFTSSEPGGQFLCTRDGSTPSNCTSPTTYTNLSQGQHTFTVRAIDTAANSDLTPASRTWTVDAIGPDTTITAGPNPISSSTSASFQFQANESPATFQCSLDGATFATCTSPQNLTSLPQGPHEFQVRAIDIAGNADDTPAVRTWTVDSISPDTQIDSSPGDFANSTTATFTFSSNEAGALFDCSLDGSTLAPCESPKVYTNLAAGQHLFGVRARDAANNLDTSPALRAWSIDLVVPDTTIQSGPSGTVASTGASFLFSANEGATTFQCSLDNAPFTQCTVPQPQVYAGLAEGEHLFQVRAVDPAGNIDQSPAARGWTVDTTAPDSSFTSTPSDPSGDPTGDFVFTSNESGSTFKCSIDVGPFTTCSSPFATPALANGAHSFEVQATDSVGNVETTPAAFTWTIITDEIFSHGFEDP